MSDAEEEKTGSAPVAEVVSWRKAMRDAKEERTVNAPAAGVAS